MGCQEAVLVWPDRSVVRLFISNATVVTNQKTAPPGSGNGSPGGPTGGAAARLPRPGRAPDPGQSHHKSFPRVKTQKEGLLCPVFTELPP